MCRQIQEQKHIYYIQMLLYSSSSVLPTGTNGTHTNEHVSI